MSGAPRRPRCEDLLLDRIYYVEDVDEVFSRAVTEGATAVRPVKDEFYGDRSCKLVDPFGHIWYVSTRKEDLSAAEVTKRYDDLMKQ